MNYDIYKPIYHFMPEKSWMNDPNGTIFYKGEYHLFYQHNPNDHQWGTIHWGHAKSKDLVHWEHLPIALFPSNELGEDHCFSGCAVISADGVPTIFYTSIGTGERHQSVGAEQWMAVSHDDMITWEKSELNPVMKLELHGDMDIREWRDPFVWNEDGVWYMLIGGGHEGKGCALIYKSDNLTDWTFLNKCLEGSEEFWECPNIFQLGNKKVLVYSPDDQVKYAIGNLNEDFIFQTETSGTFDHSGWEGYYAPNSLEDSQGRRIMWGWLTEGSRGDLDIGFNWAGVQSVPRILTLDSNEKLRMEPTPELQALRYDPLRLSDIQVIDSSLRLAKEGRAFEMIVEFIVPDQDDSFGVHVLKSSDGAEQTSVVYHNGFLSIDRSKSSLAETTHKSILSAKLDKASGKLLKLHIFVDHSTIEVFADYKECISTRIYPTKEDSVLIEVFTSGDTLHVKNMQAWSLKSIWNPSEEVNEK